VLWKKEPFKLGVFFLYERQREGGSHYKVEITPPFFLPKKNQKKSLNCTFSILNDFPPNQKDMAKSWKQTPFYTK